MATFIPNARQQFCDANGVPLAGGSVGMYVPSTLTPSNTWQDAAQATLNVNPIPLDMGGYAAIYGVGSYRQIVKDALGNTVYDRIVSGTLSDQTGSSGVGFIQSGTGTVARTAQDKLRETVSVKDFGAVGDGVTDDTAALTNFWNSAITNPGVPHLLEAKTYLVKAPLPAITVSNVWIEGRGADTHDVGTIMTGTVIVFGGTASAGKLVEIASVSGASKQRIANIVFRGVGLNCNSLIAFGLSIASVRSSDIDVTVANATSQCVGINAVATLGEARDPQNNRFRLKLRAVEYPSGIGLALGGDASANVSMNEFWVDVQHANAAAMIASNADNNTYHFFRSYKVPSGTATEAISLLGGSSEPNSARAEKFNFFTANLPIHAYGTASYTYPSTDHTAFLDADNNTPVPIIDAGASVHVVKSTTTRDDDAWVAYTPTVTATSGTITTVAGQSGFYRRLGKRVDFKVAFSITTNGTGTGALRITLPVTSAGSVGQAVTGKERAVTGKSMVGYLDGGASVLDVQYYDGVYPGVSGGAYGVSGSYEAA